MAVSTSPSSSRRLSAKQTVDTQPVYRRFWAPTAEARREKLMPFFWGTLMRENGSIAGNRALKSVVHLTNRHWFSYPGYSEILVGAAHDDVIKSNDAVQNPYPTVLEFIQKKIGGSSNDVALFGSWSVFNAIGESRAGALTINAGFEAYASANPAAERLSDLQFQTPTPWDSVRHDVYTTRLALSHLATYRPRVLYLALGETDDWAHDGRYDRVLEAYARSDAYLKSCGIGFSRSPTIAAAPACSSPPITAAAARRRTGRTMATNIEDAATPGSRSCHPAGPSAENGATMRRSRRTSSPRRSSPGWASTGGSSIPRRGRQSPKESDPPEASVVTPAPECERAWGPDVERT